MGKTGVCGVGILIPTMLGLVMRKATADTRRGRRWNFTTVLEDVESADDIALLSSKFNDLHENCGRIAGKATSSQSNLM